MTSPMGEELDRLVALADQARKRQDWGMCIAYQGAAIQLGDEILARKAEEIAIARGAPMRPIRFSPLANAVQNLLATIKQGMD